MLSFIFVIVCVLLSGSESASFLIICLCVLHTRSNCWEGMVVILSQSRMMWSPVFFSELIEFYLHTLKLGSKEANDVQVQGNRYNDIV